MPGQLQVAALMEIPPGFCDVFVLSGLLHRQLPQRVHPPLPLKQSVVHPGSRCPRCGTRCVDGQHSGASATRARGPLPLCRAPISLRYPIVEASRARSSCGTCWCSA
jgi:prepilin signal peptidase PulO-like enzyme (type II secretory pathway)